MLFFERISTCINECHEYMFEQDWKNAIASLIYKDTGWITDKNDYRKVSNIKRTFVGNNIVDHSDVVGASPVGAAPTTSSFST